MDSSSSKQESVPSVQSFSFHQGDAPGQPQTAVNMSQCSRAILHLCLFRSGQEDPQKFMQQSQKIMKVLASSFSGRSDSYFPWLCFLKICKDLLHDPKSRFKSLHEFIEDLLKKVLLDQKKINLFDLDWRILRNLLAQPSVVRQQFFDENQEEMEDRILAGFKLQLDKSIDWFTWANLDEVQKIFRRETLKLLKNLRQCYDDYDYFREKLLEGLKSGRFEKFTFQFLAKTLIIGQEGGLFLLLNTLTSDTQQLMKGLDEQIGKNYFKTAGQKINTTLGSGGSGKVRLALDLFGSSKRGPGSLICCKKISQSNFTFSTIQGYFYPDIISTPRILDFSLIVNILPKHRKGYLFMEFSPNKTAKYIFGEQKYQKWNFQKSYLLGLLANISTLLTNNYAFTDLKLENTLYDVSAQKTILIDLGGIIKSNNLSTYKGDFIANNYYEEYPVDISTTKEMDLVRLVTFLCGKIVQLISLNVSKQFKQDVRKIGISLMENLIDVQIALQYLKDIGSCQWQEQSYFTGLATVFQFIMKL